MNLRIRCETVFSDSPTERDTEETDSGKKEKHEQEFLYLTAHTTVANIYYASTVEAAQRISKQFTFCSFLHFLQ
jgi:hypothetical protein